MASCQANLIAKRCSQAKWAKFEDPINFLQTLRSSSVQLTNKMEEMVSYRRLKTSIGHFTWHPKSSKHVDVQSVHDDGQIPHDRGMAFSPFSIGEPTTNSIS